MIFDQSASLYQLENDTITENDPMTMDEEYEVLRIARLPENLQQPAVEGKLNQFNAIPSYVEQNME